MIGKYIDIIKCPYCGNGVYSDLFYDTNNTHDFSCIINCNCNEYQIIDGILYYKNNEKKNC